MNNIPQNREAVIAIQGGGVYGLSLLGQLQAIIEDHKYVPLAFAGTSAGAILACLSWAGFTPTEIRNEFLALEQRGALASLLEPPKLKGFDLEKLSALKTLIKEVLRDSGLSDQPSITEKVRRFLSFTCRWYRISKLGNCLLPHYKNRGLFTGDALQGQIDAMLRRKIIGSDSLVPKGQLLRFSHVADMMKDQRTPGYHPPLLITATNLTRGRLEIISSIASQYANVPIAKAVRASAGFPVFFTPEEIQECPGGGWFVDGGLVSNFPIWTFSDAFRSQIESSYLYDIYGHIVNRPWIRIGLRVVDDAEPAADLSDAERFFRSLTSMLTGGSRNQLEELLARSRSRSIVIKQPYSSTGGPENILDLSALTKQRIVDMVKRGRTFADSELKTDKSPSVTSIDSRTADAVRRQMKDMVASCALVMQATEADLTFRANVFLPVVVDGEPRMRLVVNHNMDEDGDRDMEFPDLNSGATGYCYASRRPIVCNLSKVAALREQNPEHYKQLFGMAPNLHGKVRSDRTWLASVPIFDPFEVHFEPKNEGQGVTHPHRYKVQAVYGLESEIDGPILGVLNVDSGWDYTKIKLDPDPNQHLFDQRVRAILGIMQAASFRIARQLTEHFPVKE